MDRFTAVGHTVSQRSALTRQRTSHPSSGGYRGGKIYRTGTAEGDRGIYSALLPSESFRNWKSRLGRRGHHRGKSFHVGNRHMAGTQSTVVWMRAILCDTVY